MEIRSDKTSVGDQPEHNHSRPRPSTCASNLNMEDYTQTLNIQFFPPPEEYEIQQKQNNICCKQASKQWQ